MQYQQALDYNLTHKNVLFDSQQVESMCNIITSIQKVINQESFLGNNFRLVYENSTKDLDVKRVVLKLLDSVTCHKNIESLCFYSYLPNDFIVIDDFFQIDKKPYILRLKDAEHANDAIFEYALRTLFRPTIFYNTEPIFIDMHACLFKHDSAERIIEKCFDSKDKMHSFLTMAWRINEYLKLAIANNNSDEDDLILDRINESLKTDHQNASTFIINLFEKHEPEIMSKIKMFENMQIELMYTDVGALFNKDVFGVNTMELPLL